MYLLVALAEENDIEPVIYEGQDEDLAETETVQGQIKKEDLAKRKINKDSLPPSILQRVKTLPKMDEMKQEEVG
jgi:hypothetical protein